MLSASLGPVLLLLKLGIWLYNIYLFVCLFVLISCFISHFIVLAKYGVATNYIDKIICTEQLEKLSVLVRYYEPEEAGPSQASPGYNLNIRFNQAYDLDYLQSDLEASVEMYAIQSTKSKAIQALNMVVAQFPNESLDVQFVGQNRHFLLSQENNWPLYFLLHSNPQRSGPTGVRSELIVPGRVQLRFASPGYGFTPQQRKTWCCIMAVGRVTPPDTQSQSNGGSHSRGAIAAIIVH